MTTFKQINDIELKIYKKIDVIKLTAQERTTLENLVDELATIAFQGLPDKKYNIHD
jgi:hypothetical protein